MIKVITGCSNCPLAYTNEEYEDGAVFSLLCGHPLSICNTEAMVVDNYYNSAHPNCPLRKENLTLQLIENKEVKESK